jgi:RNA polymerase sigma-54 factor
MLNQKLQQKLLQKLSPQQIQLIKLLELPTLQLEQRIKKELEENPTLEEGSEINSEEVNDDRVEEEESENSDDEFSIEDYITDDDEIPNYRLSESNYSKDDKQIDIPYSGGISFREHLISQLGLRTITEEQDTLAKYLIGNLDEDGYLRRDLDAIIDDLAFTLNMSVEYEVIRQALDIIQDLEPVGVGARDLQECLLIQIKAKDRTDPVLSRAYMILRHHFEEFTKKHYDKIEKRLDITEDELKESFEEIIKLNPKPGGAYNDGTNKSMQQIIPDFLLDIIDGELQLSLNQRNAPELRISRTYADMLRDISKNKKKSKQEKDTLTYVKSKLDSAKWFIDAILQRQATLLSTMNEIILYQKEYFLEGDETKLRPMILKDIAERTGLDISTISRVANSKYIQTHFGIYALKYFFSEGMMTDSGEEVSTREIKKILQDCIDGESKKKPLTDDKLAAILKEKGYVIARRTVAKYREQLDIPVARLRKEL